MSFNTLSLPSLSLVLVLPRSGHYQLCPGMSHAGAGIGKLQKADKEEQAVMVNGFISHLNTVCVADLQSGSPWVSATCWDSESGTELLCIGVVSKSSYSEETETG